MEGPDWILTPEFISEHRAELLKFEATSTLDIQEIWIDDGVDPRRTQTELDDPKLPYDWRDPLYMKMVHRYRNCGKKAAVFCHQLDPHNQAVFRDARCWFPGPEFPRICLVEFLAWVSNMLSYPEILRVIHMEPREQKDDFSDDAAIELWKTRPIAFILELTARQQLVFLEIFNAAELPHLRKIQPQAHYIEMLFNPKSMVNKLSEMATDLESMNIEDDVEASE